MSVRNKRTGAETIAHLEHSIRKFGDYDGSKQAKLDRLQQKRKEGRKEKA